MPEKNNILEGSHGISPEKIDAPCYSPETMFVRGYTPVSLPTGAVSVPIVLSSTFAHPTLGQSTGFDYSRGINPTRLELEKTVASMEKGGYALGFSSGMAAISCLLKLFRPGDEIIVSLDLYGGTWRIFSIYENFGLVFHYVDTSRTAEIEAVMNEKTRAIFVETVSNPTMKITDVRACADLIHGHRSDGLLIVDNTFLTPYLQTPLLLGADIAVHSGTKYLSGHHDSLSGFLIYNDPALDDRLRLIYMSEGAALSAFDSYMVLRGIKTLALRMDRSCSNARKIAEWLKTQKTVTRVYYAGFSDWPNHEVLEAQAFGAGAMVSFEVADEAYIPGILSNLHLILFAESLGGVQTLMTYPTTQTHNVVPQEMRHRAGVTERLLRLSVGIENADELIADLKNALDTACGN